MVYTTLFQYLIEVFDLRDPGSYHDFLCGLQWFIVYYFRQYNAWILVFMTIERTIAVFKPLHSKRYLRRRNIIAVLTISALLLSAFNTHFWFTEKVQGVEPYSYCYYTEEYQYFGNYTWPWIDFALMPLIPFVIILTLNICIIAKMGKVYYYRRINMNVNVTSDSAAFANMTIILLAVSAWFFLTSAPKAVLPKG